MKKYNAVNRRSIVPGKSYPYPVTVTFKRNVQAIYLRITRDGKVRVSAPDYLPMERIEKFIDSKDRWIQENLRKLPALKCYDYHSGEMHYFLGKEYPVLFSYARQNQILIEGGEMKVFVTPRTRDLSGAYKKLMKEELAQVIEKYIEIWAPRMKVEPASFTVRVMKSRWGSCNVRTGELCFALDLVTKPEACIESVVVHELNHLLETGHTRRFHDLMAYWIPDYKERTRKLSSWPREFV